MRYIGIIFLSICILACESQNNSATQAEREAPTPLKLNQLQVLGTHNSYAQPIDSNVMAYGMKVFTPLMKQRRESMDSIRLAEYKEYHPNEISITEALSYHHPPLKEQLDAGMRSLELDVFYDPDGGRFTKPAAYQLMQEQGFTKLLPHDTAGLHRPGFKVLHIADFDFRSHCPTFEDCLGELKNWSDSNPKHTPIFIMLEIKQNGLPIFPNPTQISQFDQGAMDALDSTVLRILGRDKLIIPDDIRGDFKTLEEGVLAKNYPTLEESAGKFLFLMLPALDENMASPYWEGRPSLEGRMMFVRSTPGTPRSAFLLLDNSIVRNEDIRKWVQKGYLVRTRADIETYEAKVNDYSRAEAAFNSGAQIISTDYFKSGNSYGTEYIVKLPGGKDMRCNPVNGNCQ